MDIIPLLADLYDIWRPKPQSKTTSLKGHRAETAVPVIYFIPEPLMWLQLVKHAEVGFQ